MTTICLLYRRLAIDKSRLKILIKALSTHTSCNCEGTSIFGRGLQTSHANWFILAYVSPNTSNWVQSITELLIIPKNIFINIYLIVITTMIQLKTGRSIAIDTAILSRAKVLGAITSSSV